MDGDGAALPNLRLLLKIFRKEGVERICCIGADDGGIGL
jgi:hypothetical protein